MKVIGQEYFGLEKPFLGKAAGFFWGALLILVISLLVIYGCFYTCWVELRACQGKNPVEDKYLDENEEKDENEN